MKFNADAASLQEAAEFIEWWGSGDNAADSTLDDLRAAIQVIACSPVILQRHGPRCRLINIHGLTARGDVIWSSLSGHNAGQLATAVGRWSQGVATYVLRPGDQSHWARGIYTGGCFLLTAEDAVVLGCQKESIMLDSPEVCQAFGCLVIRA